jgi:hypothetical protein
MRITQQHLVRLIVGVSGGFFWVMTVASVAAGARGNDYGLAMIVGNVAGVAVVDRWLRWARGLGVFAAALLGGVGALLVWDALPWKSGEWMGYGYWTFGLSVASSGLWWGAWGYRQDGGA